MLDPRTESRLDAAALRTTPVGGLRPTPALLDPSLRPGHRCVTPLLDLRESREQLLLLGARVLREVLEESAGRGAQRGQLGFGSRVCTLGCQEVSDARRLRPLGRMLLAQMVDQVPDQRT